MHKSNKKRPKICVPQKKRLPLHHQNGVLAHLARARHWQCRGERFESAILHNPSEFRINSELAFV